MILVTTNLRIQAFLGFLGFAMMKYPKYLKITLIIFILHIFKTILTSKFPSMWKFAKIIVITKPDESYRSIAIFHTFGRLLNVIKLINIYTTPYWPTDNQVSVLNTPVIRNVFEELRSKMDKNMVSLLVFLDHSKIFDTVDHDILCYKLKNTFKFSTSAVKLLLTYLYRQYTMVM